MEELVTTKLSLGAEKPFALLHISDTHLCLADDRDNERKNKLAESRKTVFGDGEDALRWSVELSKELGTLLVHTGDLLDFVSEANIDAAKKFTDENDCFFAAGNHEFSLYVGEAWEDEAYRNQSLDKVQAAFKNDIRFCSRVVNGINLVAIDNSYYRFEREQFEKLKAEVERGLPILLFMHNPMHTDEFYNYRRQVEGVKIAYLTGTPAEMMQDYDDHRFRQQCPDEITAEVTDYIANEPTIKALFTGHLHKSYEMPYYGRMQYVTGGAGYRIARKIEIE
ncbi:MAG: metallophosphoesterase [Clostridia bacterium]|nr:metallophosphoesterase [Clostridia bacterium]